MTELREETVFSQENSCTLYISIILCIEVYNLILLI